jgi:LPXTG-motif cell wall-anchored protein
VSADGTHASGAVDIVHVNLLGGPQEDHVTQLAIGHMESSATVPAGGIACPIPVTKVAVPNPVQAGHQFTYTITAYNTICTTGLKHVRIEDHISADPGVEWTVVGTKPKANTVTDTRIVWNDIGTIAYGKSKSVQIRVHVSAGSAAGYFHDHVDVRGSCGVGAATGVNQTVDLTGSTTVDIPQVTVVRQTIPKTGGAAHWGESALVLAVLGLAGLVVRRRLA